MASSSCVARASYVDIPTGQKLPPSFFSCSFKKPHSSLSISLLPTPSLCSIFLKNQTMGSSVVYLPLEHSPRMLKDFLIQHDSYSSFSSENDLSAEKLLKSRSRSLSAFQAIIKSVKNIHFTAIKSPSILPRSLSRRLSRSRRSAYMDSETENKQTEIKITVTIKDIIRWKSFRDIVEEKSPPSDLASSPHHCTTTTTASTPCSSCSNNGSSWCDSDFTSEYGNFDEYGENEVSKGYLRRVGEDKDSKEQTTNYTNKAVGIKEKEKQQHSPVSVIDIEFEEDEFFYGDEEEKMEKRRVPAMKKELVKWKKRHNQRRNDGFDSEMLSRVKTWIDGEQSLWIGWDKKQAYVREMEREGKWSKFEEEEEEVALAIENRMLDELLVDLFS
ncbi:hypothetical protein GH714_038913 [Hevea brasiliensis]|uniref:DUF4378 domain-containing protein n=1 Tax=Hevea brasiliensis TaxID=3981 RepID=A0A6A6MST8_HEVBR|nr:hypothetical protein GH714_038913 [Hevea brasiliensis]